LGGDPKPLAEVVSILKRTMPVADDEQAAAVLNALCALISAARVRDEDGRTGPFLDVSRATSRRSRSVEHLLCGRYGWLSMGDMGHRSAGESETAACAKCGSNRVVRLHVPDVVKPALSGTQNAELSRDCLYCRAKEGLIIFGARAASLTRVLCSQTFDFLDQPVPGADADHLANVRVAVGEVGVGRGRVAVTAVRRVGNWWGETAETWWRPGTDRKIPEPVGCYVSAWRQKPIITPTESADTQQMTTTLVILSSIIDIAG